MSRIALLSALSLSLLVIAATPVFATPPVSPAPVPTHVALLVGSPDATNGSGSAVVVIPGTVLTLQSGPFAPPPLAEEQRAERLADVARSIRRTLRLGTVEVRYTLESTLAHESPMTLPPPSSSSELAIAVEMLAASNDIVTYRVFFTEGARSIADSRVAVRRGERAVVGGVDGPEAPYLFLVLEPGPTGKPGSGGDPVAVDPSFTPPRKLLSSPVEYTAEAREVRLQGVVILQVVIDETGHITGVKVLKGLPYGLTEAAVESVETWRFEPARDAKGNPVKVYYNLTINFRLEDPKAEEP